MRQTGLWTIAHGNGYGAIEMDNRRRLNPYQLVVKRNNLSPIRRSPRAEVALALADFLRQDPIVPKKPARQPRAH
jgi:hypothetical protein